MLDDGRSPASGIKFQPALGETLTLILPYQRVSRQSHHRHRLRAYFRRHPPATINEARAKIHEQKCELVATLAAQLDIKLLFLPSYSPGLNLFEKRCKLDKKEILYSKYYPDLRHFRSAITDCLSQAHTTDKKELDSSRTLDFRAFSQCDFIPIWAMLLCERERATKTAATSHTSCNLDLPDGSAR